MSSVSGTEIEQATPEPAGRQLWHVRRRGFYARNEGLIFGVVAVVAMLAIWQAAWDAKFISPLFFSGPSAVAKAFVQMTEQGTLLPAIAYTWANFFTGFFMALFVAVPLGVVLGWYRRLLMFFDPLISIFYATPRIAFYPLIIIWLGVGAGSKIFVIFLSALLPILINTIAGVRNLDRDLVRAARAFCATDRKIFLTVALPSSIPFILTGVRQGVAHGLIGAIIAELFAGSEGLGYLISYSGQIFATDQLLVGVICVAASGLVLTIVAERIQRHFQRWRPSRE